MNRRTFLTLLPIAHLVRSADRETMIVEASGASTYFAPYLVDRLTSGRPLSLLHGGDGVYLTLDGSIVGRLPGRGDSMAPPVSVVVAGLRRDEDDRLHLFVALTGA